MDKIKQIEAFVNAAEKGSLAKASLVLGITPVMLGRRIDALERRLGIKLMHRTTRHLTLTERGTVFLDHCRKILDELEQAEQMIGEAPSTRQPDISSYRLRLHSDASMSHRMHRLFWHRTLKSGFRST